MRCTQRIRVAAAEVVAKKRQLLRARRAEHAQAQLEGGQVAVDVGDESPHVAIVAGHRGNECPTAACSHVDR